MLKQDSAVQRNDLDLRMEIIGLDTEIYKVNSFEYLIYCLNYTGDFNQFIDTFNSSIRHIGLNIELTNVKPLNFLYKIDNIPKNNVVNGFKGLWMTEQDLFNFIQSKFYNVDVIGISIPARGLDFAIEIEVANETGEEQIITMKNDLLNLELGTDNILIRRSKNNKENSNQDNQIQHEFIKSFEGMGLSLHKEFQFTLTEADTWFNQIDDIYIGKMTRNDMAFFRENSSKCFLDCSVFGNINLRRVLLLYDTVYLAPPINSHFDRFMDDQNIVLNELVELIDMGKLVLLLPNQETRYNNKLLLESYNVNPNSIVGRRGVNTLLTSYFVETKNQYVERIPQINEVVSDLYMRGAKDNDCDLQNIAQLLAWPITAAASSFKLTTSSPMSVAAFGINDVIYSYFKNADVKKSLEFEFTINSLSAHISTALQATYFPVIHQDKSNLYSNSTITNIMGDYLKMFWYNAESLDNLKLLNHQNETNFIKLFECNESISILKVARLADDYKTPDRFRAILSNFEKMDEHERKRKINEYNDLLFDIHERQGRSGKKLLKMMMGGIEFLPIDPRVQMILSLIGIISDSMNDSSMIENRKEMKSIEKIIRASGIANDEHTAKDIYLLDKISRVAMLK